jgi:hypothetical protein
MKSLLREIQPTKIEQQSRSEKVQVILKIQPTKVEQRSRLEKVQIIYWITKQVRKSANHSLNNEASYIEKVHVILKIQPTKVEQQSRLEKVQIFHWTRKNRKRESRSLNIEASQKKCKVIHWARKFRKVSFESNENWADSCSTIWIKPFEVRSCDPRFESNLLKSGFMYQDSNRTFWSPESWSMIWA